MTSVLARSAALVGCLLAFAVARAAEEQRLTLPLVENFGGDSIPAEWKQDLSKDNSIAAKDGQLVFAARANTFAHISRPLGIDSFRATVAVKPDGSANWAPSIILYWDPSNWTQVNFRGGSFAAATPYVGRRESGGLVESYGLLDQDMGQFYQFRINDGQIVPKPPPKDQPWRCIGVEIDRGNVRALTSDDNGKTWVILREMPRDNDVYRTPPKMLIVGKGMSDPPRGLAKPDMDNDFGDRGPIVESRMKELRVVALQDVADNPARPSPVELRDTRGEKILAGKDDPSFDSVAPVFPPMKYGRELVGIKDHRDDFTIFPDGAVHRTGGYVYLEVGTPPAPVRFGSGGDEDLPAKMLYRGHLPIVISTWEHDGLKLEQTVFAHSENFSADAPIFAYLRLRVSNSSDKPRALHVAARGNVDAKPPLVEWDLKIPAGGDTSAYARLPYRPDGKVDQPSAGEFDRLLEKVANHWESLLHSAATIDVSAEPRVNDAYRAWLAYNFLNVDKIDGVYHPQDNSAIYPAVFGISAAWYCQMLDDYGYHDDARRYLESLLTFVQPDGTFIVNYGLPDAGALLMAIEHHYRATGDGDWLKSKLPMIVKIADRFLARRLESRSKQSPADKWYGMVFEQPYCDYTEKAYDFVADLTLAGGLLAAGDALKDAGVANEAERFRVEGEAYRRDILAAMKRSVVERDGQKIIPLFPQTHALLKAADFTAIDYYGLQAGQILEKNLLDPNGFEARSFVDMLEKRGGLILGTCRFAGGIDHAYTFGYWFNCIQRDEPKKAILGFYASLACGMTRDTYSGVEVTFLKTGTNYPTLPHLYSGTQQLNLLRAMLCCERGDDELVLCAATPRPWLADGKHIAVRNFSTRFGDLSFTIDSHVDARTIKITLDPPTRTPAKVIRVRLRQPTDRPVRTAKVIDGRGDVAVERDDVVLRNAAAGPVAIEASLD